MSVDLAFGLDSVARNFTHSEESRLKQYLPSLDRITGFCSTWFVAPDWLVTAWDWLSGYHSFARNNRRFCAIWADPGDGVGLDLICWILPDSTVLADLGMLWKRSQKVFRFAVRSGTYRRSRVWAWLIDFVVDRLHWVAQHESHIN